MPATTSRATSRAAPRAAAARKSPAKVGSKRSQDAVALLRADHKKVADLFEQFEKSRSPAKKKQLVAEICLELTVHAQVEEEIFYPEVQAALRDKELVPEAKVEHQSIKDLIAAVEGVEPYGEDYDAKVKVMSEWVKHHVREEQNEMFPKAKTSKLDLIELGERIQQRKDELLGTAARAH